jgi:uncharacterized membrane protein (DUF106 family)
MLPFEELLIYSTILSFFIAVVYRLLTKPEKMREIKKEMAFYREKANSAQKSGNKDEANKYSSEMLKMSQKQLKSTMKPMLASMVIFFIALGWFNTVFETLSVTLPVAIPFIGTSLNWFWWYIIITIPATLIFRKLLGVE